MLFSDVSSAAVRGPVPVPDSSRAGVARVARRGQGDVLVFALRGMSFALPAERVVDVMPLAGDRWSRLARMARGGTLGASGLPLIRLADRLGLDAPKAEQGALVLFGEDGKVRATLLVDDTPRRVPAHVVVMPAAWRDDFEPCEDLIGGIARLDDGTQAALIDLPIGVAAARPRVPEASARDSAHLLVRAGRFEMEAVRVAALTGMRPIDGGRRMLLILGGEGEALAVDEVVGLAPQGRVERLGGARVLVTSTGRYRLLEPGETLPMAAVSARVLLTAPSGDERTRLRDLVRSMGHDVSLADDPRAARLVGGRFDIVLFDLDAYGAALAADEPCSGGARRIGFGRVVLEQPAGFDAVVPARDPVALIAALIAARHAPPERTAFTGAA